MAVTIENGREAPISLADLKARINKETRYMPGMNNETKVVTCTDEGLQQVHWVNQEEFLELLNAE